MALVSNSLTQAIPAPLVRSVVSYLDIRSHFSLARCSKALGELATHAHAWPPDVEIFVWLWNLEKLNTLSYLRPRSLAIRTKKFGTHNMPFGRSVRSVCHGLRSSSVLKCCVCEQSG